MQMKLLFKRQQTTGLLGRINFFLWAKLELDTDELALIKRYKFEHALLLGKNESSLIRTSVVLGGLAAFLITFILNLGAAVEPSAFMGIVMGSVFAFWFYNERREQVFVRDLIHGRHFKCPSVIDLTKTEAELSQMSMIFRQVLENAKNWDGEEVEDIPVLSKEEARNLILEVYAGWR